jgi:hypothetical protein
MTKDKNSMQAKGAEGHLLLAVQQPQETLPLWKSRNGFCPAIDSTQGTIRVRSHTSCTCNSALLHYPLQTRARVSTLLICFR